MQGSSTTHISQNATEVSKLWELSRCPTLLYLPLHHGVMDAGSWLIREEVREVANSKLTAAPDLMVGWGLLYAQLSHFAELAGHWNQHTFACKPSQATLPPDPLLFPALISAIRRQPKLCLGLRSLL